MKKGAIFDMDGLLFDTERVFRDSWVEMAARFGQTHNPDFPAAVCGTSGEGMRAVVRRYYPEVDAQAFIDGCIARAAEVIREYLPEKPGMREILSFFRTRGVRLAVASSSGREMIEDNLRRAGVLEHFDAVVSGTEVERGKPEPDIFLLAARMLGCAPEDCYVFEDGVNGARAGIAAGCATVMIPDLAAPPEDLRTGCAGIFASLNDAREALAVGKL